MMIRKPKKPKEAPKPETINHLSSWHSLTCELITPMYGGGVESAEVDKDMPIHVSGIRGSLRFWWRLLAKHKWKLNDIPKAESELWGGVSRDGDDGKAGKVLLKIAKQPKVTNQNLIEYNQLKGLRYALFPAYNEKDEKKKPHKLLKSNGITWQLQFAFIDISDIQEKQVIETLRWWANFGGVGFRSRKGLGAIVVSECTEFPEICQPLMADEVKQVGCQLVVHSQPYSTGILALEMGIQKYSDFRQGVGVGRNKATKNSGKPAGRSYWSEPDAIRKITGTYLDLTEKKAHQRPTPIVKNHKPVHEAGEVFPRAVFGLPILYKFMNDEYCDKKDPKDKNEKRQRIIAPDKPEPALTEVNLSGGERLASPLIIRPRKSNDGKFEIIALVLPYQDILNKAVILKGVDIDDVDEQTGAKKLYPIWQNNTAEHIKPICENGGGDPIQAFLTYFKENK